MSNRFFCAGEFTHQLRGRNKFLEAGMVRKVCVGMGAWIGGIIFTPKLLVSYLLSTGTWNSSFSMTIPSSSSSPPVVGMGGAG